MQIAAQTVVEEYDGVLPASYEKLLSLKGIGSYTAGAIASIAYDIPVPAVDGNVLRVITRIIEDDGDIMKQSVKKRIENKLQEIMPRGVPRRFQSGTDGTRRSCLCAKWRTQMRCLSGGFLLRGKSSWNDRQISRQSTEERQEAGRSDRSCDPGWRKDSNPQASIERTSCGII